MASPDVSAVVVDRTPGGEVVVRLETRPTPAPGPGDLLVRPEFVGICGTDLELLGGHLDRDFPVEYPHVLGHEWSGTVLETGRDVTGFAPGDLVVGHGDLGGNRWFGVTTDGAMASGFRVPAHQCFPVPAGVSAQRAALVEPLACVLAGLRRVGGADGSQVAAVFGCGTLGLAMIGLLRSTGATVVAIDPSERRRTIAEQVGADLAVPAPEPGQADELREEIAGRTGTRPGVDLAFEASGAPTAQAAALSVTGFGARVLYLGLAHGDAPPTPLRLVLARQLTVRSSTGAPPEVWPGALRLTDRTGLDLTPAVSSVHPFSDCAHALAAAAAPGSNGKVMLRP
jgi:threonine dehydrogenase-like Zn-dependent dehydrogenase